jgi:hypothetical protein
MSVPPVDKNFFRGLLLALVISVLWILLILLFWFD